MKLFPRFRLAQFIAMKNWSAHSRHSETYKDRGVR
jgi:hypothetical protein